MTTDNDLMSQVRTALNSLADTQNHLRHAREYADSARVRTVLDESILAVNKVRNHLIAHLAPYGVTLRGNP